ncbi:MAG: hypothetical protein M3Q07_17615, partial [Pseudobdellovibrionaceae bacterium]|nr:hypothetical protein [Pseudobdellovibrionaceae bacterium]
MKKIWWIGILSFLSQSLFTGCVHKDHSESRTLRDPTILYLDHAYFLTQSKEDFESLMTKGFLRNEEIAHHPGQLLCQFVNLKTPVERSYYIEICHKDPRLPKDDLSDSKDPRDTAWPGVS